MGWLRDPSLSRGSSKARLHFNNWAVIIKNISVMMIIININ